MTFTVAIVGRPNVGKSTLFNRLIRQRLALVDDTPGVTRDRREGEATLGDLTFRVFDTAGLENVTDQSLEARMRRQTERAIQDSNVALFLIDARAGVTPTDRHFAQLLRRGKTPVLLVANKCEGKAGGAGLLEAFELGLGEPIAISAEHGEGLTELYDALVAIAGRPADGEAAEDEAAKPLQLAVVGRSNFGKSALVNKLIGEDRLLVGPEAGITRDAIAVPFEFRGRAIKMFDTAGIRRRPRVQEKLEKLSVADTLRAIQYAEVVILVIDATQGLEKQDLTIAANVVEEGRALVLAVNKWDAVEKPDETLRAIRDRLSISLPQVRGIPLITVSALQGRHLEALMKAVFALSETWNRRVGTADMNRWLEGAVAQHPPPLVAGRPLRIRYATQIKTRPPTFALFVSKPQDLPDSYVRYLVNSLRDSFGLDGVPIRTVTRKGSKNPYVKAES
ncbi:MAG: ribosome biogenesis GTPase Der [Alphaproteobacteria bacterium]|nr:ribosome biogenesis GTPase Der [Alphaproteobacteria bacterium]